MDFKGKVQNKLKSRQKVCKICQKILLRNRGGIKTSVRPNPTLFFQFNVSNLMTLARWLVNDDQSIPLLKIAWRNGFPNLLCRVGRLAIESMRTQSEFV